ncbi:helix-turn-helix domain-containing protein [Rhodococcus antarcticus]|uniref:Helix-turn-helix domain-containing protein n=1 Tax=Rhodococcus antarcticus TaxID=2987751 RepID=A0ABY6NVG4_9NOCA|nr:helix-turn-helix transcriptional regulator [Rhodococcus antarcticus]UZJ23360.1 helix-turn-helix domain-containing protein [Rhodococcus antarcticus]
MQATTAALGALLRQARGERTVREVAARAGLAEETLRKIERGAVPTPNLFAVAALALVLDVELSHMVQESTLRAGDAATPLTRPR